MLIQGGELVMGTLCKKTLGASGGSLIHVIWMEEGPEAARAFLSQTQYLVNHWLLQHGFSIGIGDTVADVETMTIISNTISKARAEPNLPCGLRTRGGARAGGAIHSCASPCVRRGAQIWGEVRCTPCGANALYGDGSLD